MLVKATIGLGAVGSLFILALLVVEVLAALSDEMGAVVIAGWVLVLSGALITLGSRFGESAVRTATGASWALIGVWLISALSATALGDVNADVLNALYFSLI